MVEHILQAQNLGELNKVLHFVAEDLSARMKHEAAAQENLTVKRAKSLIHEFYSDGSGSGLRTKSWTPEGGN